MGYDILIKVQSGAACVGWEADREAREAARELIGLVH